MADRPRFAVYVRISRDPDGVSTATKRQLKDCRAFAKLRGWDIVEVYDDPDISAWRKGAVRPRYEAMLEAMAKGELDGVLVWRLDRLVRRTAEFARFWQIAEANGVRLAAATQPIDTSDPVGMLIVTILVAFAQMESETMSLRIKAEQRHAAEAGRPRNRSAVYGLREGWTEVEPAEADVICEVAGRLLAGQTLGSIVVDLNERAIRAPEGGEWRPASLRTVMRACRIWGWREHHGEPVAAGDWPAIVDEATGRAVRALLGNPGRHNGKRRFVLSGILRCGRCGWRMKAGVRTENGKRKYTCPSKVEGGCGRTAIDLVEVEAAVHRMVEHRLGSPDVARALAAKRGEQRHGDEAEILRMLGEAEAEREQNSEDRTNDLMSRATFLSMQRALDRRVEKLNRQLAAQRRTGPLAALVDSDGRFVVGRYRDLPMERQRAVIEAVADGITVLAIDHPTYLARLRTTFEREAEEFRSRAAELRTQANATEDGDERQRLRKEARRCDGALNRRRGQIERGASAGNQFRVERLDPQWIA